MTAPFFPYCPLGRLAQPAPPNVSGLFEPDFEIRRWDTDHSHEVCLVNRNLINQEENNVKQSIQDRAAGKLHIVSGSIKEKVGQITKDPDLEAEGTAETIAGKVQMIVGRIEKVVGE